MLEGNTHARWKIGHVCHIWCFSWTSKHNRKYLRPMLPPIRWWSPSVAATRCLSFDGVSYLRIKRSLLSPFYSYSSKMDAHPCNSFSPLDFFFESSVNLAIKGLVTEELKVEGTRTHGLSVARNLRLPINHYCGHNEPLSCQCGQTSLHSGH